MDETNIYVYSSGKGPLMVFLVKFNILTIYMDFINV